MSLDVTCVLTPAKIRLIDEVVAGEQEDVVLEPNQWLNPLDDLAIGHHCAERGLMIFGAVVVINL